MKNLLLKKSTALFLSLMMLMTCLVWVSPLTNALDCAHTETKLVNKNAATCEFEGYSGDLVCAECGDLISEGHTIAPYDHDFSTIPTQVIPATCTSGAIYVYKCRNCSQTNRVVDKSENALAAHTLVLIEEIEPTCEKVGYCASFCTSCNKTVQLVEIPATGHTDENADGKCDVFGCGGEVEAPAGSVVCTCHCHSESSFMQFIYRIEVFFWKLFGIGKTCECGAVHY